jgi:hypothetical protein
MMRKREAPVLWRLKAHSAQGMTMERRGLRGMVWVVSSWLLFIAVMALIPLSAAAQPATETPEVRSPARQEADRVLLGHLLDEPTFDDQVGVVAREYAQSGTTLSGTLHMQVVAWAFADEADARIIAAAGRKNLEEGRTYEGAVELDAPDYGDESALFVGEAVVNGTEVKAAFLLVRDGVTVSLWSAAGIDGDQTEALLDAADARWGAGRVEFEPGSDPKAAMLALLPDLPDLPDGFALVAEATIVMAEPAP